MKSKLIIASLLLVGACASMNAQEKDRYYSEKATDNIFVGAGIGGMAVINDGVNTPTFNFNVSLGKFITPVWAVRGQVGALWQTLEEQETGYSAKNKKFVELNFDAMLNLTNWIGGYNPDRLLDLYLFAGPTMNFSKAVNAAAEIDATTGNTVWSFDADGLKTRFGATAGLGLGYDINDKWAINLEGRFGVTPSIFGNGSDCRKAESTVRVNLGATYTFGGKKFIPAASKLDQDAINAEVNKYREEVAQLKSDLANAKGVERIVEKEVIKEVTVPAPMAVFFKIGSARLDDYAKVDIQLAAKAIKASGKKYKVAGYCDKATGSVAGNQKLSEKRAQAVYDALIAEGVSADQLECVGFGGTDNMFGKNFLNRVVIVE